MIIDVTGHPARDGHAKSLTSHDGGRVVTKRQSPRHKQIVQEVEGIARALAGAPLRISKIYKSMSVGPGMVRFAFRIVHGCSPRRFFRDQRLRAVRSELRSASPGLTVTEVATRHGFVELGRFAAQ
jgi:methylphosphotriester-DNA--protein-cysteine methyltransferase